MGKDSNFTWRISLKGLKAVTVISMQASKLQQIQPVWLIWETLQCGQVVVYIGMLKPASSSMMRMPINSWCRNTVHHGFYLRFKSSFKTDTKARNTACRAFIY